MARVGDEIDRECTNCKTLRGHVVAAVDAGQPAMFVCKFCGKRTTSRRSREREERAPRPGRVVRRVAPPAPMRAPDPAAAKAYRQEETFATGDTVRHGKFGLGVVEEVAPDRKIRVRFADATRVLVAGR